MRYLIYLLGAVNLVFFLWHAVQNEPAAGNVRVMPALPADTRSIQTLEEMRTEAGAADISRVGELTASLPPGAGQQPSCQVLGPISANWQVDAISKRLEVAGFASQRRSSEIKVQTGYWIYLPAMKRDAAMLVVKLLDEANDREYFVGRDNVISLGAFEEMSRAEVRLKSARKLGLDPLLEPTYETRSVYWLDLEIANSGEAELATIIKEFPDIQIREAACP